MSVSGESAQTTNTTFRTEMTQTERAGPSASCELTYRVLQEIISRADGTGEKVLVSLKKILPFRHYLLLGSLAGRKVNCPIFFPVKMSNTARILISPSRANTRQKSPADTMAQSNAIGPCMT